MSDAPRRQPLLSASQRELLAILLKKQGVASTPRRAIPRRSQTGAAPLSFAQQRLWFLDQLAPDNAAYSIFATLQLHGALDVGALERSLTALSARHDMLRTVFVSQAAQPVQVVMPLSPMALPVIDLRLFAVEERETVIGKLTDQEIRQPFDLARGPLLRLCLLRLDATEHVLLLNLHHIIADGWSMGIFIRELAALYDARTKGTTTTLTLPELAIQYADFSAWQRGWESASSGMDADSQDAEPFAFDAHLAYWQQQLAGAPAVLELPTDRPRPAIQSFRGARQRFLLPLSLLSELHDLCRQEDVTIFMALHAAFATLLYRYSGQQDVVVGTPIAGRNWPEVEGVIGFFANTLVLRTDLSGNPTFRELLARVRETTLAAYAHQDVPFERLVEALQPERDLSHSPVFQVMIALQNVPMPPLELAHLSVRQREVETGAVQFDLTLSLEERDQGLRGVLEYSTGLFDEATITRMIRHYHTLLASSVAHPDLPVSSLALLPDAERRLVVVDWNSTHAAFPADHCVHDFVVQQAHRTPDAPAVRFRGDTRSYADLLAHARHLAASLREHGVQPEVRVGLCVERSFALITGLLGILLAGGVYVPLDPDTPAARLAYLLADARVPLVLTQPSLRDRFAGIPTPLVCLDATELPAPPTTLPSVGMHSDHLAYVLYTSGSTGWPKGVMTTHQAVVNRLWWMQQQYGLTPGERVLHKTSSSFDVSLWELLWPLLVGATLVLAEPGGQRDPHYLWQTLVAEDITTVHFVPSMLAAFLQEPVPQAHQLRRIICSGEALPFAVQEQCLAQLPGVELHNLYGPTEAAIDVTAWRCAPGQAVRIGKPINNVQTYVLDEQMQSCPVGVPGELYLGGVGLARGYLGKADRTAERFVPHPFAGEPGQRLYRTGDRVRWSAEGTLDYLGRLDQQVKLRGYRIELGEIEAVLRRHPSIQDAVIVLQERSTSHVQHDDRVERQNGNRQDMEASGALFAYVVLRAENLAPGELRAYLKRYLPDYMIPARFVELPELPHSANGKVDLRALRALEPAEFERTTAFVAPQDATEAMLVDIWSDVLGLDHLGIDDNFFELGGHSLIATQVISRIRDAFAVEIPLRALFEAPTVASFARHIETAQRAAQGRSVPDLTPMPRPEHLPLSFAQQRLWFLDQFEPGSPLYNVTTALRLEGAVDVAVLRQSIDAIVRRHEILHTVYALVDGQPVQQIIAAFDIDLPLYDLTSLGEITTRDAEIARLTTAEAQRPFDLTRGPLFRAALLRLDTHEHVLLLNMHHIVSDGWSLSVFIRELAILYGAYTKHTDVSLPPLPIQYADFALWQREWLQGEMMVTQLEYWQQQLADIPTLLALPTDRPRPKTQTFHGARLSFVLPKALSAELQTASRRAGTTLFMTLLTAFAILLGRYANQDDVVVGTPIANRITGRLEDLIGFFVNTLVLRADLGGNPTFRDLLAQVRETTLGAYAHQDLPFERLVESLHPERNFSHTPLFQVWFALHNAPMPSLALPELVLQPLEIVTGTAKFDLSLALMEHEHGIKGVFEYNTDLFDAVTIARMRAHWQMILVQLVQDINQHVADISLLTAADRAWLLEEWNATQTDYPRQSGIHDLIAAQVKHTPDAIAIVMDDEQITYRELDERANQLAHYLLARGVGPEQLVGICVERSMPLVVGLLGILKAGGAYLPMDPGFPRQRLAFMATDARLAIILTQGSLRDLFAPCDTPIICLDAVTESLAIQPTTPPPTQARGANLAYVLYTSGSTGQPKGVQITHGAVVNFLTSMRNEPGLTQTDHLLSVTTISFDIAGLEIYLPLIAGARLELVGQAVAGDGEQLQQRMRQRAITIMQATPATWRLLLATGWRGDRHLTILCGGEALPHELARELAASGATIWNLYGPTETTIWSAVHPVASTEEGRAIPIGTPIANTQIYVLDAWGQPVPVGIPGEIYIGGAGLSRGYLNRPDLTAERFVPQPFRTTSDRGGTRLYRTGDLARRLADGSLEFLGRADQQVKLRGYRIELAEIEATLEAHPAVRQAVVVTRATPESDAGANEGWVAVQRLIAYIVPEWQNAGETGNATEHSISQSLISALREHLHIHLPDYMVPSAFVILDALPLTPNNKIDRRALPDPDQMQTGSREPFVAPAGPVEEILANIWKTVLHLEPISTRDNFFELGGHSLMATQVISRAREAFQIDIPLRSLFERPTVAQLAQTIEDLLFAEVESLTDEEAEVQLRAKV